MNYETDECLDWLFHHQCHRLQIQTPPPGYPLDLLIELSGINRPPCGLLPESDGEDQFALAIGKALPCNYPHRNPLSPDRARWIAKCPFEGGRNLGRKKVFSTPERTHVEVRWISIDEGNDDDRDGRVDRMHYVYCNGRAEVYHMEYQNSTRVHSCLVDTRDGGYSRPREVPNPPRHSWDYP